MLNNLSGKCKQTLKDIRDFLDEKGLSSVNRGPVSRLERFAHFWLMVGKNFSHNRCPVKAASLAYTTLLALIPMLFVAVSISSVFLKKEGEKQIESFVDKVVSSITPPSAPGGGATGIPPSPTSTNDQLFDTNVQAAATTKSVTAPATEGKAKPAAGREELVRSIDQFIHTIQSGTLGVTGGVLLIFAAISMLSRIECTFNDIWGVEKGRGWVSRIVRYWTVTTMGPLLLAAALVLASGSHLQLTRTILESNYFLGNLIFQLSPVLVLCVTFGVFYMLMPNTKVHWDAALAGGLAAGILWHLNNYFSVLYVSRWVSNSKIYGSLAVIPVFMVGLYFSWLIMLFGAQVAYAYQNRAAYLQEKQAENVNQRGREFVALRLMQCLGQRFLHGDSPPTVPEMADGLVVPTRLVQQLMHTLTMAKLAVEIAGKELAYAPARPLERISCHDILLALRAGQGEELATRDDPARVEMYGEFEKIMEAERKAASAVTLLDMVHRTDERAALAAHQIKAVTDGGPGQN